MTARLRPLAEREFGLLFLGRTVALFGTAFAPIALAFAVLDLTGSATDLGVVVAAGSVPQILLVLGRRRRGRPGSRPPSAGSASSSSASSGTRPSSSTSRRTSSRA